MTADKKFLATREIWARGLATVRATKRQTLFILVVGLILPQLILSVLIDFESGAVVDGLRAIFTSKAASPGSFTTLAEPAITFMGQLGVVIPLIFFLILASYYALVHLAVEHQRVAGGVIQLQAGAAWLRGLRSAVPGSVVLILAVFVLTLVGQVLVAPAVIMAVLSLIVPVILVTERRGALRCLWHGVTMKYVRRSEYSGWTVLFNLLTIGALLYAALIATGFLSEMLLFLDERLGLSRAPWVTTFPGLPFGPVYLAVSILETTLSMAALSVFPAMSVALYFTVAGKREISRV